jgi:hypothetical protein
VIVAIEVIARRGTGRQSVKSCSIDQKNVGPAVVIVIEDRDAGAGSLDDVFLCFDAAEDVLHGESGFLGNIGEVGDGLGGSGGLGLFGLTE